MTRTETRVRFGPFEADLPAGELRKSGLKLRLAGQPFEILSMLLERPGEVVTREQLRQRLWPQNTYVDYEHSLNAAINKLREALSDSADRPLYVETLPRRGYRFIAPVEAANGAPPDSDSRDTPASASELVETAPREKPLPAPARRRLGFAAAAIAAVLAIAGAVFIARRDRRSWSRDPIRALAVLPFENLSRDPEQDYFADGITEALISRLSQIQSLHVISRTSVMQYRGAKQPLPEIAKRLSVDAVVEGTVQRAGDRVAIVATLVDATADRNLWTGRYEGDLRDVLGLQSQVAGAIAEGIRAKATAEERSRAFWSRQVDPDAYAAYLKGRFYAEKSVSWATGRAVKEFQESIRRDPTFAPAWARLGESLLFSYPPKEKMPQGKAAALHALELNPNLTEAHVVLGLAQTFWDWDWAGAERSFQRALELNPASSDAHYRYSHLLAALGRFDPAIAECRQALLLDPFSPSVGHYLGRIYYFARRYDEAVAQFQKVLELDPNDYWSNLFLSNVYGKLGRFDQAQRHLERACALEGMSPGQISLLRQVYGEKGLAAALRELIELTNPRRGVGPLGSSAPALLNALIGDVDEAIAWLQRAFDSHTRDLIYVKVEPAYDSLRSDPRFVEIQGRIGLPK